MNGTSVGREPYAKVRRTDICNNLTGVGQQRIRERIERIAGTVRPGFAARGRQRDQPGGTAGTGADGVERALGA